MNELFFFTIVCLSGSKERFAKFNLVCESYEFRMVPLRRKYVFFLFFTNGKQMLQKLCIFKC